MTGQNWVFVEKESAVTLNCIRVVGCLCALLVVSASAMGAGWEHDFETALMRARASEQPLLIHFHAHWCGPCRNMERNVLNTAEVLSALTTNLVGVKVESDARRDLIQRYGITALPSHVLHRASGTASRSGYVAKLTRFGKPSRIPTLTVVTAPTTTSNIKAARRTQSLMPTQTVVEPEQSVAVAEQSVAVAEQSVVVQKQAVDAPASRTFDAEFTQIDDAEDPDSTLTTSQSGLRIGLDGYCPVALSTGPKWIKGTTEFRFEHQRVNYFMSSAAQLKKFRANPGKYIPHLHGCDPVALQDENRIQSGAIELGASYRDRVYFFATESNRAAFLKTPERFSAEQAVAVVPPGTASDG